MAFLQSRIGRLDSVVLSGGECTLYLHLEDFCRSIKALGYKIKIDTNGSNPNRLQALISQDLIDYVALDYKAPKSSFIRSTTVGRSNWSFAVETYPTGLLSII